MEIQKNDTLYKEIDIERLFDNGKIGNSDEAIEKLQEKNNILRKGVKGLKREQ